MYAFRIFVLALINATSKTQWRFDFNYFTIPGLALPSKDMAHSKNHCYALNANQVMASMFYCLTHWNYISTSDIKTLWCNITSSTLLYILIPVLLSAKMANIQPLTWLHITSQFDAGPLYGSILVYVKTFMVLSLLGACSIRKCDDDMSTTLSSVPCKVRKGNSIF